MPNIPCNQERVNVLPTIGTNGTDGLARNAKEVGNGVHNVNAGVHNGAGR